MLFRILFLITPILIGGCSTFDLPSFEKTVAEGKAGYSYIPIPPSSVTMICPFRNAGGYTQNCPAVLNKSNLLKALPDNSVRVATRLVSGKAEFGFPKFGASTGIEGNTYDVIIDFVNTQTVNAQFAGSWLVNISDDTKHINANRCYPFERSALEYRPLNANENWTLKIASSDEKSSKDEEKVKLTSDEKSLMLLSQSRSSFSRASPHLRRSEYVGGFQVRCGKNAENLKLESGKIRNPGESVNYSDIKIEPQEFNIPVYVGIGLRLKANVTVINGKVNLVDLPALTAAVEAGNASGTMSVQTIGISGKTARSNLLFLNKIDTTTIQNAIQSLSSIKSSIEDDDTIITPRIVGFHNTIGAESQGVNLIHSLLSNGTIVLEVNPSASAGGEKTK